MAPKATAKRTAMTAKKPAIIFPAPLFFPLPLKFLTLAFLTDLFRTGLLAAIVKSVYPPDAAVKSV